LISAIGAGVEADFDVTKIRYDKIILVGRRRRRRQSHSYAPAHVLLSPDDELVNEGHVYVGQPPLYSTLVGKEKAYLHDDVAKAAFLAEHPDHKNDFQRLKGLGEMDFDELRDTTMDPTKRALLQITVEQAASPTRSARSSWAMTFPSVGTSFRPTRKTFAS